MTSALHLGPAAPVTGNLFTSPRASDEHPSMHINICVCVCVCVMKRR